jgi:hypothetical protein
MEESNGDGDRVYWFREVRAGNEERTHTEVGHLKTCQNCESAMIVNTNEERIRHFFSFVPRMTASSGAFAFSPSSSLLLLFVYR